ncbi:hypothetical protein [Cohnella fermenti]|uniref:Uncharacterized protein n=1 Tax=Cohnella fermenti TaxID=2565925 RepID=A0A4V3WFT8_9BACL|nr:hypothetical protein [Cohnella fermenti]THF81628.1 hypothetical protein E6C55_07805 [Cohnella fermenti]
MRTMTGTLNTLLSIRTSTTANRFFYYFRKVPFIGRLLPDTAYSNLKLKRFMYVIVRIVSLLWGFAAKFAYLGLLFYLPIGALGGDLPEEDRLRLFFHLFLLLSFVVAGVTSAVVLETKREKYIAVKLMRVAAARYMKASLGYRYVLFFVQFVPALLFFIKILGGSALQGVLLAATATLWRVLIEYQHLRLFEKTGMVLIKNNAIVWLTIGIGYAAAYAPLLLETVPYRVELLVNGPLALTVSLWGSFAAVRLARYPDYARAVEAATKRDDPLLNLGQVFADAQKADVKKATGDYTGENLTDEPARGQEGYAYLNSLFFARHRKLIAQPLYRRLAIIGGIAFVGTLFALLKRESIAEPELSVIFPYLPLALFFLSIGERVCKAMFYNCDLSLLRYGFYRNAANRHFRIRLRRIVGLNLIVAAAIAAALTIVAVAIGAPLGGDLVMLWVYALSLSVLFSVHHLFMYYIFQPYSVEWNSKNPMFHVLNALVSMFCGASIWIEAPASIFFAAALILTPLYLVAALVLVKRIGPRTFRIK